MKTFDANVLPFPKAHQRGPLPNFLVVGASRSGTTTLHQYLGQHPDVFFSPVRQELQFFSHGANYAQGLDAYREMFSAWRGQRAIGDVSPPYFFHGVTLDEQGRHRFDPLDDAPARVARVLPDAQIVITLRNPVQRAYSQFWKARRNGKEPARSFREAIELELAGRRRPEESALCWIHKNRYATHVGRWLSLYPRQQVLVFLFEEWTKDPASLLRVFAERMEIDPSLAPAACPVANRGWRKGSGFSRWLAGTWLAKTPLGARLARSKRIEGYPPLERDTEELVWSTLRADVAALRALLAMPLDLWKAEVKAA